MDGQYHTVPGSGTNPTVLEQKNPNALYKALVPIWTDLTFVNLKMAVSKTASTRKLCRYAAQRPLCQHLLYRLPMKAHVKAGSQWQSVWLCRILGCAR